MALSTIVARINKLEKAYDVKSWKINDLHIWPLIRMTNKTFMSSEALGNATSSSGSGLSKGFRRFNEILSKPKDLLAIGVKESLKGKEFLFLSDGVSYANLDGEMYERFCEPIMDVYAKDSLNTVLWEVSYNYKNNTSSKVYNLQAALDRVIISSMVKTKLGIHGRKLKVDLKNYENFLKEDLPYKPSIEQLIVRYHKINELRNFYKALLSESKIKKAFIVSYYYDAGMAFNWACEQLGIVSVDIQHGVQGDLHLAYGRWNSVPNSGYSLLPAVFWVWSKSEFDAIEKWSVKTDKHQPFVGGNMFANKWLTAGDDPLVLKFDRIFNELIEFREKPIVLVTLSPGTDALMEHAWKAIESTQDTYNWCIRLHPNMLGDLLDIEKSVFERGIKVKFIHEFSSLPLYVILRNIDLHLTAVSSTVIEAFNFGVPSIVTSVYGFELYEKMIDGSTVVFQPTIKGIKASLKELTSIKKGIKDSQSPPNEVVLQLFENMFN